MADFEKLNDNALDGVSGGQKYSIGNVPVPVHAYPNGPVLVTLYIHNLILSRQPPLFQGTAAVILPFFGTAF